MANGFHLYRAGNHLVSARSKSEVRAVLRDSYTDYEVRRFFSNIELLTGTVRLSCDGGDTSEEYSAMDASKQFATPCIVQEW